MADLEENRDTGKAIRTRQMTAVKRRDLPAIREPRPSRERAKLLPSLRYAVTNANAAPAITRHAKAIIAKRTSTAGSACCHQAGFWRREVTCFWKSCSICEFWRSAVRLIPANAASKSNAWCPVSDRLSLIFKFLFLIARGTLTIFAQDIVKRFGHQRLEAQVVPPRTVMQCE
jgi:hypothetical protein